MKFALSKTKFDISWRHFGIYVLSSIIATIFILAIAGIYASASNLLEHGSVLPPETPAGLTPRYSFEGQLAGLISKYALLGTALQLWLLYFISKKMHFWNRDSAKNYAALAGTLMFLVSGIINLLLLIFVYNRVVADLMAAEHVNLLLWQAIGLIPGALLAGVIAYLMLSLFQNTKSLAKNLSSILFVCLAALLIPYLIGIAGHNFAIYETQYAIGLAEAVSSLCLAIPIVSFALSNPKKYWLWAFPAALFVIMPLFYSLLFGASPIFGTTTIALAIATLYCFWYLFKGRIQ